MDKPAIVRRQAKFDTAISYGILVDIQPYTIINSPLSCKGLQYLQKEHHTQLEARLKYRAEPLEIDDAQPQERHTEID